MNIDWAAVAALGQLGTLVAIPVTVLLYNAGRKREEQNRRDSWEQFYSLLDKQYLEILKILIEHPQLAEPSKLDRDEDRLRYDAFAFAVWNFVEAIFDYGERDPALHESWHHILILESRRHAEWFSQPRNRRGFKARFCQYIDETSGGVDLIHSAIDNGHRSETMDR
jgi:hypothetical protein